MNIYFNKAESKTGLQNDNFLAGRILTRLVQKASLVFCFIVSVSLITACAGNPVASYPVSQTGQLDQEEQWGVRVLGIHRTAAGYMLDFRYKVLDADKASSILNRKLKPELIVESDGRKLRIPVTSKLGPLRQSAVHVKEDRNYFMFFANPGKLVKSGDKVTVVIGDFKVEHLTVN